MINEKHILEEFENIKQNQPLWPGNTISHETANECVKRGWATRDKDGNFIIPKCNGPKIKGNRYIPCKCKVVTIEDHVPIDGPIIKDCLAFLTCGRWEFVWNL